VYESEPVGYREQPWFWNLVVRVRTALDPSALLAATQAIETRVGRRPTFPQGPRVLDIDILLMNGAAIDGPGLCVPHPRLDQRAFVLRPLLELDPDLVHPVSGRRLSETLEQGSFEVTRRLFPGTELLRGT
jgi:2-amino-4-hydroxy-6-hydroxymethyldihydropteridine diphosphokinase